MQIAIVSETWPPEVNGVALTVHSLARGLQALGHRVQVIRPRPAGSVQADRTQTDANEQDENVFGSASADWKPEFDEVLVPGLKLPRYPELRFGLPAAATLERLWRATRPDAIYVATEGPLGRSAVGVAERLGVPACTGFHTRFDDFARHYGFGFLTPLVFRYLRNFHNRAAATLVPTTELADFLRAHGFRGVSVLRRAVDTQRFNPCHRDEALRREWGLAPDQLAVIYVGRIAAEKKLDLAVRAFRLIEQTQHGARFIFVGDGPARAALMAQNPDFIHAGVRRGVDLSRHYASADLFLFPSLSETFGNVTLEGMASGLPVVAFDYGAAHEHLLDGINGACVPRDKLDAFIAGAVDLGNNAEKRERFGAAARHAVAALNPTSVARSFADVLASLIVEKAA
ncbi:MAG: glycosyltransferase family 1 protein [Dokdonella sp.]